MTENFNAQELESLVKHVGSIFGYENLGVEIDSSSSMSMGVSEILGYAKLEENKNRAKIRLGLSKGLKPEEVEHVVAHEFADYEYSKKHPRFQKFSKTAIRLPMVLITFGLGTFINTLYDTLADGEARKRGIKIPYYFHIG